MVLRMEFVLGSEGWISRNLIIRRRMLHKDVGIIADAFVLDDTMACPLAPLFHCVMFKCWWLDGLGDGLRDSDWC
jgi:hypothetical protein